MIDKFYLWSFSDDSENPIDDIRRMNSLFFQNRFTLLAQSAIKHAYDISKELGHSYVGSEHLLMGLIHVSDGIASKALTEYGLTETVVRNIVVNSEEKGVQSACVCRGLTPRVKRIIEHASSEAATLGHNYIGSEHLLMGLIKEGENIGMRILSAVGLDPQKLYDKILRLMGAGGTGGQTQSPYRSDSKKETRVETKIINQYGKDLTSQALNGRLDPVIGREQEIIRVMQILSRRQKNNPALIGEPGVGKSAIAEGLAQKIASGDVPSNLANKKLISLDLPSMLAGTKYRGEFEERIKNAVEEVIKSGDIILFIDEMHTLIGAGAAEGSIDASNILKPALSRGEIQVIGATTLDEYRKHIEKDSALERRFQPIIVKEPSAEDTRQILLGLRDKYEAHHRVKISDAAIDAAIGLSVRYINDRYLPDKAIDLIDEAASLLRIRSLTTPSNLKNIEERISDVLKEKQEAICGQDFEKAAGLRDRERELMESLREEENKWLLANSENKIGTVEENDIASVLSTWTGIPLSQITDSEADRLMHIEDIIHSMVIGQNQAVTSIARAIRRGRVGLKDPDRPIGSFIFLGPTGVGKTELSKALAYAVFGDEKAVIRIDMSEFMEKHAVSKITGSPPGYIGYDEGGQLTEKIRRNPYSVILFDEIEKAHPDIWSVLLQILEDGRLTDSQGRDISFKNTIIIMTSNTGARYLTGDKRSMGFSASDRETTFETQKKQVINELKKSFRPEFLNRIDEIIVFNRLNEDEIRQICSILLNKVKKRLEKLNVSMKWDEETEKVLAKEGFDEMYGARPLRRVIQSKVEDVISEKLLTGEIEGGETVCISAENGKLLFNKEEIYCGQDSNR